MNGYSKKLTVLLAALLTSIALLALSAAPASAATGPVWKLDSFSPSAVEDGGTLLYTVEARNVGDEASSGPIELHAVLPAGLTPTAAEAIHQSVAELGPCPISGQEVACTTSEAIPPREVLALYLTVSVANDASGTLTSEFEVSGGAAAPATTVDPLHPGLSATFGLDAFDSPVFADEAGAIDTAAASHPYSIQTSIDLNTYESTAPLTEGPYPPEPARDILVETPPGFIGNPTGFKRCALSDLAHSNGTGGTPLCEPASQVGSVTILSRGGVGGTNFYGPVPLFNLIPPPGRPAQFGMNVYGSVVVLDARVRSDGDYGLTVGSRQIPEALALAGTHVTFWGDPASEAHRSERGCAGERLPLLSGVTCAAEAPERPFLRNPTSCTAPGEGLSTTVRADSWTHPGAFTADGETETADPNWKSMSSVSHQAPGYPYPPEDWGAPAGIGECENVKFEPTITVQPTTNRADSPTGLNVDLQMPQGCWLPTEAEGYESTCQADVKDSVVTQPVGTRVNPATATGLTGCSEAQIGYVGNEFPMPNPIHFKSTQPECPNASKIGTVEIESPLLPSTLEGGIFQAKQGENPFGSTLAFYAVAYAEGVMIKLPAEVRTDPKTGAVTTIFKDNPQLPFSHYKLHFFGGSRAPLITPPTCGIKATRSTFTGWANPDQPVHLTDYFEITEGANGAPCPSGERERPFDPSFEAGTANPLAGAFSGFVLKVSREDGMQELSGLEVTLPPGLIGKLAGIPYCSDAAIAAAQGARGTAEQSSPNCPAASLLGVSDATAGAGAEPFHNPGKVYLAGPYKGAPLSVAIVTPAVAGPLDLGTVVVRAALHVDPETTQIHVVSDPIPNFLEEGGDGFPLDVRQVVVQMNRPNFTLNPTSCDAMSVGGHLTALQGATADVSSRFQVGSCDKLVFKPTLKLRLKGKTNRGAHPALRATLTMPPSHQANIARAQVTLPHAEFLDQGHIRNVCTQVQFHGAGCPASSILGYARAYSPLLEKPLEGPVYLMSGFGHKLPDLAADLNGQIRVLLHGKVDTGPGGGIRNTFTVVPDAPVTKFTLSLRGGARGLIVNSESLCAKPQHATALFDAQNGKVHDFEPLLRTDCGRARRGRH